MTHYKYLSLLTINMLFFFSAVFGQQSSSIYGKVTTKDGKPASFITISVEQTKRGAISNEKGEYTIKNIQPGSWVISTSAVGIAGQQRKILLIGGQNLEVNFVINETAQQLKTVTVNARLNRFAEKQSDNIARMPLSDLENSQVYNVVTNSLMKERTITNYSEVFYNVPAVSPPSITPSRGNEFFMRGFYGGAEFKDGMTYDAGEGEDPVNLERIEILKGPSATLFGSANGSFGGIINNVTKIPFDSLGGSFSYSIGSWGLSRLTLDFNTPLNKDSTLRFRINGARHWENSFEDYGFKHTYTVAPTILYKPNSRLTFRLSGEFYSQNSTMWQWYSFGPDVTIKNIKDLKAPYSRSAAGDQMLQQWSDNRIFGEADYKLSGHWKSTTKFTQGFYYRPQSYYMNGNQYINDSTMTRWIMGARPQLGTTTEVQQNFNGDFKIGELRNRLLIGLDVLSQQYKSSFVGVYQDTLVMNDPSSLVNVSREKIINSFYMVPGENHYISVFYDYSAYVSDVLNITDRLTAMASLRFDRYDNKNSVNNGIKQSDGYQQNALSPKFGLVYQVVKNEVSLFANYMNGFSNNAPQNDGSKMVTYKPSQANQWEGGVKMDLFQGKLSSTLSYYNIDVKNALRSIPTSQISIQDGTEKSKGFEAEIIANPVKGLNLMAGYGYNDAKYTRASEGQQNLSLGSPKNMANFYGSYKILNGICQGLGVSFGANYIGESSFQYPVMIPSYLTCNASVMYDRPKYNLSFKINNLSDEKYWSWNFIQPQPPRNFVASVTYKF